MDWSVQRLLSDIADLIEKKWGAKGKIIALFIVFALFFLVLILKM